MLQAVFVGWAGRKGGMDGGESAAPAVTHLFPTRLTFVDGSGQRQLGQKLFLTVS